MARNTLVLVSITFLCVLRGCSTHDERFSAGGYVADSGTRTGIEGAYVSLSALGKAEEITTDGRGYFEIYVSVFPDSASAAVLTISKDGYSTYSDVYHALGTSEPDTFFLVPN